MNKAFLKPGQMHAAALPKVNAGMLRVGILTQLPSLLYDLGHEPDRMLAEIGIDPALLKDPDTPIPFLSAGRLMDHCVKRTARTDLGILLGERGNAKTLGAVGLLLSHSPDVGSALAALVNYLHHHDRGAVPTFARAGSQALLGYAIYERDVAASEQIYATALGIGMRIMQELCGPDWHPGEVHFPFRKPENTEAYKRLFRAPLRFDADRATLVFPASWLKHPLPEAIPKVRHEVKELLDGNGHQKVSELARRVIRSMLVQGEVSEAALAKILNMSRRTLNRRLESEGTQFLELLQEVRLDAACQLLRHTDNPVSDIAVSLGYAGAAPFRRAFKRWTGLNPGDWRTKKMP